MKDPIAKADENDLIKLGIYQVAGGVLGIAIIIWAFVGVGFSVWLLCYML